MASAAALLLIVVLFRAVIWHPDSTVLLQAGDASSAARDFWAMDAQGRSPFTFVRDEYLMAPEGQERAPAVQIANALEPLFVSVLGPLVGFLAAVNLYWLLGLALSVLATIALFGRIGLHPLAAFGGTVGFVFSQWEYEQLLYGHVAFAHLWVFPLTTLALLWAADARSSWSAVVPGLLVGISFYASSYLGLFVAALAALFFIVSAWHGGRARLGRAARVLVVGAGTAFVTLLPAILAPALAPSNALGLPPGSRSDLHGADLSNYVIPSAHNALYGRALGLADERVGENILFFGFVLSALALAVAVRLVRGQWPVRAETALALRFAFWLLPAGLLLSMPAYLHLGSYSLPLPSAAYVVGGLVQWWRFYIRFGILVGFALALLAAFALDRLLRSRTRWAKLAAGLAVAAIALEALPWAGVPKERLLPTPASRWIEANAGGEIVAVYPIAIANAPGTEGSRVWNTHVWSTLYLQTRHGHRLYALPAIQPRPTRTDATRMLTSDLRRRDTPGLLRDLGVRYVLTDDSVYGLLGLRPPSDTQPGLELVARLDRTRVFRVVAPPKSAASAVDRRRTELARRYVYGSPAIRFEDGFYGDELFRGAPARWLRQDGVVRVQQPVPRSFVTYELRFRGFANTAPRRLTIRVGDRVLTSFDVLTSETIQVVRLRLPEAVTSLRLHAEPGPTKFGDGTIDRRLASVYVLDLSVEPVDVELDE